MAPDLLEFQHHGRKLAIRNRFPNALVADVVILAKIAQQVAMGEKYRAGTVSANQGLFFPEMRVIAGNHGGSPCLAYSRLAGQAIHLALPGTQHARFQEFEGIFPLLFEKALFMGFDIIGFL
jgi:hypothetical protein